MIGKLLRVVHSLIILIFYKLRFGKKINFDLINMISGKITIKLNNSAFLKIGTRLVSDGPLYIKAINNGSLYIGDRVYFNHNCSITCANKIVIGEYSCIANNVVIVDHDHVFNATGVTPRLKTAPVYIGKYVWIGANVVITSNVTIGDGAVIAAGSIVTSNVPAHTIVAGIPARVVKNIAERNS